MPTNKIFSYTNTTGTGVVTPGNSVAGYRPFGYGLFAGEGVNYQIDDSPNWEVGVGIWNSNNTLTRGPYDSSAGGSTISLSGNAIILQLPNSAFSTPLYGCVNKFRNPDFSIWQRGFSGIAPLGGFVYTADGWIIYSGNTALNWFDPSGGPNGSAGALGANGGAPNPGAAFVIVQRIEGQISSQFDNQTITISASVFNGTRATITPSVTTWVANSVDNWTFRSMDIPGASFQPCPNSQWTRISYTFSPASANCWHGYEVDFNFPPPVIGSDQIWFTEADIRITPGIPTGINYNPPFPELRGIMFEMPVCQRYYQINGPAVGFASFNQGGSIAYAFPTPMRNTPAINLANGSVNGGSLLEVQIAQHVLSSVGNVSTNSVASQYGARFDFSIATPIANTLIPVVNATANCYIGKSVILETGAVSFSAEL